MRLLWEILIWLFVGLAPAMSKAAEPLPRSVLIIDQLEPGTPFFASFFATFRSTLNANSIVPISYYPEHLDFGRYRGPEYEELLRNYFRGKYREGSVSVIVVNGSGALGYALRLRDELWPGVPLVFAGVEQNTSALTNLPPNVTGTTMRTTLRDAVTAARLLVPGLERIALVGDPLERQPIRRHFLQELPVINAEVGLIDLTGLSMTELRRRVAALPERTAILYTAIYVDGAGVAYGPREAAALVAAAANRPMVIDRENLLGFGGTGGFLVGPAPIGEEAGRLVLRILGGESASDIPVTAGNFTRPIFDWRELKRWNISESRLPPGSEIRFREFNLWEQYRWLIIAALAVVLAQAAIIMWLYFERRRRRIAETALRQRLMEVVHLNRTATAAALSASIAHELSQPLGAIQSYAEAAELYLKADPPNLERVEQILANILRDNQRAADVISHLRGLLKRRGEIELQEFDSMMSFGMRSKFLSLKH